MDGQCTMVEAPRPLGQPQKGFLQGSLVDSHAHAWGPDMPFAPEAWTRPDYIYSAEDFLADMARHGTQYGVIAAASLFGTYSDYTLSALSKYPHLRGTANFDPAVDFATIKAMRDKGIVGTRLQWFMLDPLPDYTSEIFLQFCRNLRDLDMHIHLNIEGERMEPIARALMATGVKLVIDHFGWHDPEKRLEAESYQQMLRLMDQGNVWVKLASGFRRPDRDIPAEYCQDLLARFGPQKLLWGSDAPFVGHEDVATYASVVDDFHHYVPNADMRVQLGLSAYQFYFDD